MNSRPSIDESDFIERGESRHGTKPFKTWSRSSDAGSARSSEKRSIELRLEENDEVHDSAHDEMCLQQDPAEETTPSMHDN